MSNEKSLENYKGLFAGSVAISLGIAFFSISLLVRKNHKTYGVLMLCGGTRLSVTRILVLEITLLLMVAWSGVVVYWNISMGSWPDIRVFLMYGTVVVLLSLLSSLLILRSKKPQYFIRFDGMSR